MRTIFKFVPLCHASLSLKDIIVGVMALLNNLIVLENTDFIWNSRKQNNFPKFYVFTSLIKTKFKTEHYIAAKTMLIKNLTLNGAF